MLGVVASVWGAQVRGTISSNDGSTLALARSLALRGETQLGPEAWRTLFVDLAVRERKPYSDRPPGTAFAALPAVRVGAALDAPLRAAAERDLWPRYSRLYADTVAARMPGMPPPDAGAGTALLTSLHGIVMGLVGLWALWMVAARLGAPGLARGGLVLGIAGCTAYGAYAPLLFSHVSASASLWLGLWLALAARDDEARAPRRAALAGVCGAMAIACDYSLVIVVLPALAATVPRMRWVWTAAGATVVAALVALYHQRAFGSPLAIGYDFSTNFAFARERASTFSGDPLRGAAYLFGTKEQVGLAARAPIVLVGLVMAFAWGSHRDREEPNWVRRWALCFLPWFALLCFHRTPWGGVGQDHRYLIPAIGLAGLAWACHPALQRRAMVLVVGLLGVASCALFWFGPHGFLTRYELPLFSSPVVGAVLGLMWAGGLVWSRRREARSAN